MRGRIYDPIIGRFTTPDPFVQAPFWSQGLNRYSYAWNNPLKYVDPSGFEGEPPEGWAEQIQQASFENTLGNPSESYEDEYGTLSIWGSGGPSLSGSAQFENFEQNVGGGSALPPLAMPAGVNQGFGAAGPMMSDFGAGSDSAAQSSMTAGRGFIGEGAAPCDQGSGWPCTGKGAPLSKGELRFADAALIAILTELGLSELRAMPWIARTFGWGENVSRGAVLAARFGATPQRVALLTRVITSEGGIKTSQTVAQQLATGRGFIPVQSILDTIGSGVRVVDPQGVAGQFLYRAEANFNGSRGTLEVLVHEVSGEIRHVLFRSGVLLP